MDQSCVAAIIRKSMDEALELYRGGKHEQLYDLLDAVHGLPEALVLSRKFDLEAFEAVYFAPYQNKWNAELISKACSFK